MKRRRATTLVLLALQSVALLIATSVSEARFTNSQAAGSNTFNTTGLQAPTSLSSTVTAGNIVLNWTATPSTFAAGHRILRGTTSGGPYSFLAQVTPRTTVTYTDTTAVVGTTYFYVVEGFIQNWTGPDSNQTSNVVAAITQVRTATGVTNGGTSVAATFSAAPAQNNLLVAVVGTNTSVTINQPAGWSTAINQSGAPGQAIFYKVAGASEPTTVTATVSASTRLGIQIYEFSNIATSSPLDRTASATGTGTAVATGTTAATTQANELLIAAVVINSNTAFSAWSNSFTERNDFKNATAPISTYAGATRMVTATGAYTTTGTAGVSGAWRGQIATFKHK